MVGYRILSSSLSSNNTGTDHGPDLRWGNLDFTLFNINVYQLLHFIELAVLSSRPDSVDLVSPLTKPEEGGVSNIQDKWPQRDPSYFFLVVISLDLTWTVDTKEFGYQGGLYRRLRTREDLKYNKDPVCRCKDDEETISDRASGARGRLWQHAGQ